MANWNQYSLYIIPMLGLNRWTQWFSLFSCFFDSWQLKEHSTEPLSLSLTHTHRGHMSCGLLLFKHCISDRRHNSRGRLSSVCLKRRIWKGPHYGCQSPAFFLSTFSLWCSSLSVFTVLGKILNWSIGYFSVYELEFELNRLYSTKSSTGMMKNFIECNVK